ncbi:amino acid adenylation domain-containing protein, partial [Phenylobacterium sp.]|uniref:amino acid adenylation domain-containing protein n=1 Tax=Phenylobacterium sp. TaxID=1871053 RepID=UPI0019A26CF1
MTKERQDQPYMDRPGSRGQTADRPSALSAAIDYAGHDNVLSATHPIGLAELFEAQAGATPETIALVDGQRVLTYAELDRHAARFAGILLNAGAEPEQVFAILSPATIESIVAILGVMKAGAAYLPLDPNQPDTRLASILSDARPAGIVAPEGVARRLPEPLRSLSLAMPSLATAPSSVPAALRRQGSPEQVAYLIYTSGSTGEPKAVAVSHRAAMHSLRAREHLYPDAPGVVCLTAPLTFDISVAQIFATLGSGGTLVLGVDPAGFHSLAPRWRGAVRTVMLASSAYAAALAEDDAPFGGNLTRVIVGGDALQPSLVRRHCERRADVALFNEYGPTEATIFSTAALIATADETPPIGAPILGTRLYLLDERLEPCRPGETGELYIAGDNLARGYWRRPGQTATRFIASPFQPGERLYRTGDLANQRADGQFVFQGRVDDQLKLRGVRIEPGEIATAILRAPGVEQAEVVGQPAADGELRLVAYVVGRALDKAALRRHLLSVLPDYMVPSAIVVLDALPLTANGKVDRKALPAPGPQVRGGISGTPEEAVLCGLVGELLSLERVGPEDDFFALGGHSLLAARLVARVRSVLGRVLGIRSVFEAPRLGDLAERVRQAPRATHALTAQDRPSRLPLSFAQARLWFLDRLEGADAAYNIPLAARLLGRLDATALAAALDDVAMRHESLRTLLKDDGGEPYQEILDRAHIALDRRASAPDTVDAVLAAEAARPFDLARDLPLRALLLDLGPDDHVLALVVHHIATDGWSMGRLLEDLATAYRARAAGEAPAYDPLPVQYGDYALWQRTLLGEEADPESLIGRQINHWRRALAGAPTELALPLDHPRPTRPTRRAGTAPIEIPATLVAAMAQLARAQGATSFMVVHAAVSALLMRLGAGDDIVMGTPVAGRGDAALDRLVGFFVNTLVLRLDLGGDPAFGALVARSREVCLDAYMNQDAPFERLVEVLDPPRVLGRQPLFQTMLVLNSGAEGGFAAPGLVTRPLAIRAPAAKFDLCFTFTQEDGAWRGELEYSAELFDRASADGLAARLIGLLEQGVADPGRPVSKLAVLLQGEADRLTEDFAGPRRSMPEPATLPALFEAQTARTPGAVAVRDGQRRLDYAQLEAAANRIAWRLIGLGAGPETVVALSFDRSIEMVAAVLGVLKAGAAYLPLEPDLPAERLDFLLADARPRAVLTTRGLADRLSALAQADADLIAVDDDSALDAAPAHAPRDAD